MNLEPIRFGENQLESTGELRTMVDRRKEGEDVILY